jgi:hypothetical protein
MSSTLPTPLRALLGLAALAVEEARKLPESLPSTLTSVPVEAVSAAMQASLRFQQQLTSLAVRGDELISQFRGVSDEPPQWATFDEDGADDDATVPGSESDFSDPPRSEDSTRPWTSRWDEVGAEDYVEPAEIQTTPEPAKRTAAKTSPAKTAPAKTAPAKKLPAMTVLAEKAATLSPVTPADVAGALKPPAKPAPSTAAPAKTTPAKTTPAKTTPAKTTPAKTIPAKATPAKTTPAKKAPAKKAEMLAPLNAPALPLADELSDE